MNSEKPSGMHRVLSDVADLALLQLQLFAVDGREAGRRGLGAILYLGIAAGMLVSTGTVALIGFGWVLHDLAGWPVGWCLVAMAGLAFLLTAGILGLAYLSIRKAAEAMHEVGAEFAENLEWLRAVVASPTARRPPYPGSAYPSRAAPVPSDSVSGGPGPASAGPASAGFGDPAAGEVPPQGGAAAGGSASERSRGEHSERVYSR